MAPLPYPRAVGAAVAVLLVGLGAAFAIERAHDSGDVVEARIVGERLDGARAYYAVEADDAASFPEGAEFAVAPMAGLLHGYPVVGEHTEVRRSGAAIRWNAWAARYPYTAGIALLLLSTVGALGVARFRGGLPNPP